MGTIQASARTAVRPPAGSSSSPKFRIDRALSCHYFEDNGARARARYMADRRQAADFRDIRAAFPRGDDRGPDGPAVAGAIHLGRPGGGRDGVQGAGGASWPDGPARLPHGPARPARGRGRLPGHVPGPGAPGGLDPQARVGSELAARRRPSRRLVRTLGGVTAAVARAQGRRDGEAIRGRRALGRPRGGGPRGNRTAPGVLPGGDRAVRPGGPHRGSGGAAAGLADRDRPEPVARGGGSVSGPD